MPALSSDGIYKDFRNGKLNVLSGIDTSTNFTNTELVINDLLSEIVYTNNLDRLQELNDLIYNELEKGNVRISKDHILQTDNLSQARFIADQEMVEVYKRISTRELGKRFDQVINQIKDNLFSSMALRLEGKNQLDALQNYIFENITGIYNDPRTLMASTNPTTMDPVGSTVSDLNLEADLRNSWNPMSKVFINQTVSVGKKGIGISAVAQKAFYALTHYYHLKLEKGENIASYKQIELPAEWGGDVIISLGPPDQRFNKASYDHLLNTFKTWKIVDSKDEMGRQITTYKNGKVYVRITNESELGIETFAIGTDLKELRLVAMGGNIGNLIPTLINSSIISSATDNAKEMKLDLLNATPEVLPAYEYLLSIGVPIKKSAEMLTDPFIKSLINVSRGNLFKKEKGIARISQLLNNKSALKRARDLYLVRTGKDMSDDSFNKKVNVLKEFFAGAEELTSLGQILGINGGIKVDMGAPLLYQLKIENTINKATNAEKYDKFSLEEFLKNQWYAEQWIERNEQSKVSYNILDVINSVPHFRSAFTVPISFKNSVKLLSKDIDNVYTMIEEDLADDDYQINDDVVRAMLRVVNDKKILDFFVLTPFEYKTNTTIRKFNNRNNVDQIKGEVVLNTSSLDGLMSFKHYFETELVPILHNKFKNNYFVDNLMRNSMYNPLFGERFTFVGSRVNFANSQSQDLIPLLQNDLFKIQDEVINGHSVYEWLFMYDLLVGKHAVGNSMSILLDANIKLADPNNIVSKWVKYLNEYDSQSTTYRKLDEITKIPVLKKTIAAFAKKDLEYYGGEDIDDLFSHRSFTSRPVWAPDPNLLPLFTVVSKIGTNMLYNKRLLQDAVTKGIVTIKLC